MDAEEAKSSRITELRRRAEKALTGRPDVAGKLPDRVHNVFHELHVQQVGLEMQNEELHLTQEQLEESRNKYIDLYNFSPVGYLTLNRSGVILETNLTAARMLGIDREQLTGCRFEDFATPCSLDMFYLHLRLLEESGDQQSCEMELAKPDTTTFYARLDTAPVENFSQLRVTITDITDCKRAEMEQESLFIERCERVKELNCMYGVSQSIRRRETIEEMFLDVVAFIPSGWQYPEITCARVCFDYKEYVSEPFKESQWKLSSDIFVKGERHGSVEVYYIEERPPADEGPFLAEQRHLIDSIARTLSEAIERKQAEEALRESEGRFQELFDSLQEGIDISDENDVVQFCNPAYAEIFEESSPEKMIGRSFLEYVSGSQKELIRLETEKRKKETSSQYELEIETAKGNRKFILLSVLPRTDDQGNYVGSFSAVLDITERRQMEMALRESEERFRTVFETARDSIFIKNLNREYVSVNPAMVRLFEKPVTELLGRTDEELFGKKTEKHFSESDARVFGGMTVDVEHTVHINGAEKAFHVIKVPMRGADGEIKGICGIARDITEMRRLQDMSERAQRLKAAGRMAGQVANDFSNLLGPLLAYPDLIKEEILPGSQAAQYLDDIKRSAEQMAEINQQLLTLGCRGRYNQKTMNVNDVILSVLSRMDSYPDTLVVKVDLCDDLMNIHGDASQIHRAVANLVINAMDAIKDIGQLTIKTENCYFDTTFDKFERVPIGEYVKITISDTGGGVPKDLEGKVFDPFFTTKTTDRVQGSGLGLSVVHAVTKDHNGFVNFESSMPDGTSFFLYFPINRNIGEPNEDDNIARGSENILVVDDDQIQRDLTQKLLLRLGYRTHCVCSGEETLENLRKHSVDLLILDMVMPDGIDGAETYQQALSINPHQKAVIISGFGGTERVEKALKMGAGAFIEKPFTLRTLGMAVRKELDRRAENMD